MPRASTIVGILVLATVATACVYPTPPPGAPIPALTLTLSTPGTVEVTVTATPTNFVPDQVQFRVDGLGVTPVVDTTAPFSITLSSADIGAGAHSVHALGVGSGYYVGQVIGVTLTKPNLVYVMVDDLDETKTPYWDAMPKTKALIADRGLTFDNSFVVGPICCASRATGLTGSYAHNTGVFDNSPPDGGYAAFRDSGNQSDTLATRLQANGYKTALVGKYLNGYPATPSEIPPGWDEWFALGGFVYTPFAYNVNHNGTLESYGSAPEDYQTDVIADHATAFIDSTEAVDDQPFLLEVTPVAPHVGIQPAPRHLPNPFDAAEIPVTPNFEEANVSDKPTWLRTGVPLGTPEEIQIETSSYRRAMGTLLSVDDLVDDLATRLAADGELENTVFVFTSDNGYNLRSHRLIDKEVPYEESIRVPLVMAGPGIRTGNESRFVTNLDFAPTMLDLAGLDADDMDGRSFAPLLRGEDPPWRTDFLIEFNGTYRADLQLDTYDQVVAEIAANGRLTLSPTYRALRTDRWLFVLWYGGTTHEYELYDMAADPYQLVNLVPGPLKLYQHLSTVLPLYNRLNELMACAGATCRT